MTAYAFAAAMAALGVNGPEDQRFEGDVDEWETIDWRFCEKQVQRIRQRIFKATRETARRRRCGLPEPCVATSCTHGSEGYPARNAPGLPGDPDWGGAFWKTNAYAPWPVWIWLNGHSWAQRQCQRLGIGYTALDNGFRACDDPAALQRICDRLGPGAVKNFFWRWQRRLPSPLTREDLRAGYVYELAFGQFEISDTRVFDRPAAGRSFFEQLIRDHLDVGRPEKVALIFGRRINRRTPVNVPHPRDHQRCRPADQLLLPLQPDQTVFQLSTGRCAPKPSCATPATSASAGG